MAEGFIHKSEDGAAHIFFIIEKWWDPRSTIVCPRCIAVIRNPAKSSSSAMNIRWSHTYSLVRQESNRRVRCLRSQASHRWVRGHDAVRSDANDLHGIINDRTQQSLISALKKLGVVDFLNLFSKRDHMYEEDAINADPLLMMDECSLSWFLLEWM